MNDTDRPLPDAPGADSTAPPAQPVEQTIRAASLGQFLEEKEAKAAQFVADLNKNVIVVSQSELASVAALVGAKPKFLGRVLEFVRAALTRDGPAKDAAMRLAVLSIQNQDREFKEWPTSETTNAALSILAQWCRIRIRGKTRDLKLRGENVLSLGLLVLLEHRVADPVIVLRELANAYGIAGGQSPAAASRKLIKLVQRARPGLHAHLALVAEFQSLSLEEAQRNAASDRQNFEMSQARNAELQQQIEQLQSELERTRTEVAAVREAETKVHRELESARRMGAHDVGDLRARYRRMFAEELEPIANDAADALQLKKPDFAEDFLDNLRKRIAEEVVWLNSSSD